MTDPAVGYIVSRFPKLSETFILNEILALQRLGLRIEIFPLLRERDPVRHPEAESLVRGAHYPRLVSRQVLGAQIAWLAESPWRYLRTWWRTVRGSAGSREVLTRTLYVVPVAAAFAREVRRLGIRRMHAHYASYPALAALVIRELADVPYSFTAHAHDIYVDRTMLEDKLRSAREVVTVSEYNRRLLRELYGPLADHVRVVRCGVDPTFFAPSGGAREPGPFRIACVASLEPYKGHRHLLDACAVLARRGLAFRCLLIGDGQERPVLERRCEELGLRDAVVFLGRGRRQDVRALLAQADAFVLASITTPEGKKEGIPVALVEALACALPVVATDLSGVHELVIDETTGLLVPEAAPEAMADALERLAGDPALRTRIGAAGRAKVLEEYDLRRNVQTLHAILTAEDGAGRPPAGARP